MVLTASCPSRGCQEIPKKNRRRQESGEQFNGECETYGGGQQNQVFLTRLYQAQAGTVNPLRDTQAAWKVAPTDGSEPKAGTRWNSMLIPYRIQSYPLSAA